MDFIYPSCETPNHKAVTIFFYLEDILKFFSASLSIVNKQEILKVTTYLAHIIIIAFLKYVKTLLYTWNRFWV